MKKEKYYSPIRNYKKFKSEYLNFVLLIKDGKNYTTFDTDAKILMYIFNNFSNEQVYSVSKESFKELLKNLYSRGLNIVVAGWKNVSEYYSEKENRYTEIKKKALMKWKDYFYLSNPKKPVLHFKR